MNICGVTQLQVRQTPHSDARNSVTDWLIRSTTTDWLIRSDTVFRLALGLCASAGGEAGDGEASGGGPFGTGARPSINDL